MKNDLTPLVRADQAIFLKAAAQTRKAVDQPEKAVAVKRKTRRSAGRWNYQCEHATTYHRSIFKEREQAKAEEPWE
jgi:hypothetical protein